jgi:hypothetical protein
MEPIKQDRWEPIREDRWEPIREDRWSLSWKIDGAYKST